MQMHGLLDPELRAVRREPVKAARDGDVFFDPEGQFRYEVHLAWTRRIPKGDKADGPLREYTLGPGFLTRSTPLMASIGRKWSTS